MDLWIVDQVTSPEKTGSGDVKTEKTKKRQKLQKKLKTNKKKYTGIQMTTGTQGI